MTDSEGIDAIILSHSDYPHAANVSTFRSVWDDVELVASSGSPEIQGLSDARQCVIGEELDILDRNFKFIDPPLADRSHTTWIHDTTSGVLFTADGFGSYHLPGECEWISIDFDNNIPAQRIYDFHRVNLVWLRYVAPTKIREALDSIMTDHDISAIAPIHGNPIIKKDIDEYLNRLDNGIQRITADYEVSPASNE